jgi:hypothetical protein
MGGAIDRRGEGDALQVLPGIDQLLIFQGERFGQNTRDLAG